MVQINFGDAACMFTFALFILKGCKYVRHGLMLFFTKYYALCHQVQLNCQNLK